MTAAILIGILFILLGDKPVGKGLILGSVFSIVNFILIGETLPLKMGRSGRQTLFFSLGSLFFRFSLMAIPLIAAIKYPQFNLFAVIPGLFMVQGAILAEHLVGGPPGLLNKHHH